MKQDVTNKSTLQFRGFGGHFCENRWIIPSFQSQDESDVVVCPLLSCHPGLHDDCQCLSLSLSLVDGHCDDSRRDQSLTLDAAPFSLDVALSHNVCGTVMMSRVSRGWMFSHPLSM